MQNFFSMVVAHDENLGIGKSGGIPWHLPADLKWFQKITTETKNKSKKNVVIMGRKTYNGLGGIYKPLPNRHNFVLTKSNFCCEGATSFLNIEECLKKAFQLGESVFVSGGGEIYKNLIKDIRCKYLYITKVKSIQNCDTFFPSYQENFKRKKEILATKDFQVLLYVRKP